MLQSQQNAPAHNQGQSHEIKPYKYNLQQSTNKQIHDFFKPFYNSITINKKNNNEVDLSNYIAEQMNWKTDEYKARQDKYISNINAKVEDIIQFKAKNPVYECYKKYGIDLKNIDIINDKTQEKKDIDKYLLEVRSSLKKAIENLEGQKNKQEITKKTMSVVLKLAPALIILGVVISSPITIWIGLLFLALYAVLYLIKNHYDSKSTVSKKTDDIAILKAALLKINQISGVGANNEINQIKAFETNDKVMTTELKTFISSFETLVIDDASRKTLCDQIFGNQDTKNLIHIEKLKDVFASSKNNYYKLTAIFELLAIKIHTDIKTKMTTDGEKDYQKAFHDYGNKTDTTFNAIPSLVDKFNALKQNNPIFKDVGNFVKQIVDEKIEKPRQEQIKRLKAKALEKAEKKHDHGHEDHHDHSKCSGKHEHNHEHEEEKQQNHSQVLKDPLKKHDHSKCDKHEHNQNNSALNTSNNPTKDTDEKNRRNTSGNINTNNINNQNNNILEDSQNLVSINTAGIHSQNNNLQNNSKNNQLTKAEAQKLIG